MLLKGNPKEEKGRAPRVWPRGSGVREGGVPLRAPPPRGGSTPELPGSAGRSRTTGGRGQQRQLRPGVEEKGRERSSGKGKRGKMGLSQGTGAKAILVKTGALHALNLLCPGLVGFFCRFLRSTARPPAPAPRPSPSVGGGGMGPSGMTAPRRLLHAAGRMKRILNFLGCRPFGQSNWAG